MVTNVDELSSLEGLLSFRVSRSWTFCPFVKYLALLDVDKGMKRGEVQDGVARCHNKVVHQECSSFEGRIAAFGSLAPRDESARRNKIASNETVKIGTAWRTETDSAGLRAFRRNPDIDGSEGDFHRDPSDSTRSLHSVAAVTVVGH